MGNLKILVAVKRVIDHNVRVRVRSDGTGVETNGVRMSMNPFCKNAVEAAVRLREAGHDAEIVVVSIGPKAATDVLLTALAMGADRGILIETDAKVEPLGVAKVLKKIAEEEAAQLVLLGKQAVDDDANQTGQMLAGLLDWSQATFASEIALDGEVLRVVREVDFGRSEVSMNLPAIVTADLRLNVPRNTALPLVIKARQKPLVVRTPEEVGVDLSPRLLVESVSAPAERAEGVTGSATEAAGIIAEVLEEMEAG